MKKTEPNEMEKERIMNEFLIDDCIGLIRRYSQYFGVSIGDVLDILEKELIGEYEQVYHELDRSRFIGLYSTTAAKGTKQRRITIPAQISPEITHFYAYRTVSNGVRFEPVTDIRGRSE